jgi:anti-sigma regulatory factor (Ser/Thr protein kinase)
MTTLTLDAPPVYALEIARPDTGSAHRARHWLGWVLEVAHLPQATVDAAILAASELVTNAVLHAARGRVLVSAQPTETGVRLVVHNDETTAGDWQPGGDALADHGRGLVIVRALASEFAVTTGHDGTTVTALIPKEVDA